MTQIVQEQNIISPYTDRVEISRYSTGVHFYIQHVYGGYQWTGEGVFKHLSGAGNVYSDMVSLLNDLHYLLCRVEGWSDEDALTYTGELGLEWPCLGVRRYDYSRYYYNEQSGKYQVSRQ